MISSDPWFEYSALAVMRMLDEALLLFTGDSQTEFWIKAMVNRLPRNIYST